MARRPLSVPFVPAVTVPLHCDFDGGDERTRTADPLLAKQVLYQLSYVPHVPPRMRETWQKTDFDSSIR